MAESLFQTKDQYNCSVCLELMKDPATIPCGHSYCMSCIKAYWEQDEFSRPRCPQCRHEFHTKPALNKNTMLAEILEKLRNTTLQGSPAQPGEVVCDLCTDIKLRAVRSCLECRASYCETHLQPHYDIPALKKHKLVVATEIQTCPRHDKLLEAFCRTDNMCICLSCVMDEHKGHDTVSSAAERDEKQATLEANKCTFVTKRKKREKELHELREATEAHANFKNMPSASGAEESPSRTLQPVVSFSAVSHMVYEFKEKLEIFWKQKVNNVGEILMSSCPEEVPPQVQQFT
ncbi:hypothetical protein PHYPO_G00097830 [Pangasianodon hypophthalmus]|uniref:RING-type domain-containing protein n=1 Tax=Pangasianodon hypophthalmus TaxID=310915 RepID=A0A5N5LBH4_PANHP|nr:hypothetical protein PHYPO_G00097830 [Pangasianodon hypophthalmus]